MERTNQISTKVADPTKKDLLEHDSSGPLQRAQNWIINAVADAYNRPTTHLAEVGTVMLGVASVAFVIETKGKGTEFFSAARNIFNGASKIVQKGTESARAIQGDIQLLGNKTAAERITDFKPELTKVEQIRMEGLEPDLREIRKEWVQHEVRTPASMGYVVSTDLPPPAPGTYQASLMSAGDLRHYVYNLNIPPEELDQNWRILDLGSGARQNLARDCQSAQLRSRIFSLDPRLAMSDLEDVNRGLFRGVRSTDERERLYGRRFPQPLTLAGDGTQLPFANSAFKRVYAHYSVPMYLDEGQRVISKTDEDKIATSISEIKRVLEPGGIARIYPVPKDQLATVEKSLRELGLRPYPHVTPPDQWPNDTYRFEGKRAFDPSGHSHYHRGRYVGPPVEQLLVFRT